MLPKFFFVFTLVFPQEDKYNFDILNDTLGQLQQRNKLFLTPDPT